MFFLFLHSYRHQEEPHSFNFYSTTHNPREFVMVVSEYTALQGLVALLYSINDGAFVGTGIKLMVDQAHNLLGPNLPPAVVDYTVGTLINLFGGYPNSQDIPASIVFAVIFGVIMIIHTVILVINTSRGHIFIYHLYGYCIVP